MSQAGFADKIVLITGAASGIGRATALKFAAAGAIVVVADVAPQGGEETVRLIAEAGGRASFLRVDVTQATQVERLIAAIVDRHGRLDIAFNNAGIELESAKTAESDEAMFDQIMAVNVKGVWLCMKYQIRQMLLQGGGVIVNTGSIAGLGAAPTKPAYAASKHAVIGLTRTAANEYARKGIRVNAVCPAVINTPMLERALADRPERLEAVQKMHPMGRVGEAEEIADAVLWLASEQSSFVTGHALPVDGGYVSI